MTAAAARPAGLEPAPLDELVRRARLLLVDPDPARAAGLAAALGGEYQIEVAAASPVRLGDAGAAAPDLVLLAAEIEGGAAAECRRLRARPESTETPLLVITERGDETAQIDALDAGAADFLSRPIHPRVLRARVGAQVTLKRQADLLRDWVFVDELTGVCNRRYFDERLACEWARAVRVGAQLGLLRIDLDAFNRYNQDHGPALGDECLRRVATLLRTSLKRPGDLVARFSGGQFVCLLPDTDVEGGLDLAHRLGLAVRALGIDHPGSGVAPELTVSMGLATKPVDVVGSVALLLRESSAQLQVAKSRGRNQSCGAELEDL
ncbi:Response regulator receiver modulated diguanylate cyclase [Rubrivivax sp. A210]|uniref:diguanylate cyclase domain-containing protein n=1 Tax=Rubrivivax sp. A210 TaxID=2772301 RepID=UPI001917E751|nr:diguanylate cyclase [Rubrivivax sp. A210]CAD5373445.1 Response regulator receiver modulated diguanylate cyclase [Rubrivivax sp. A210]